MILRIFLLENMTHGLTSVSFFLAAPRERTQRKSQSQTLHHFACQKRTCRPFSNVVPQKLPGAFKEEEQSTCPRAPVARPILCF